MPQCMDKYKEKFTLEFAKVMQINAARWNESKKNRIKNLYTKWVLAYIGVFFAGFIPAKREGADYDLNFHIIFLSTLAVVHLLTYFHVIKLLIQT